MTGDAHEVGEFTSAMPHSETWWEVSLLEGAMALQQQSQNEVLEQVPAGGRTIGHG